MKRLAAFLIAVCLAFCVPLSSTLAEESSISADLSGNGALTAADAARMLRLLSLTPDQAKVRTDCDLTRNGTVNANDARAALLYACGEIADWDAFAERLSTGLLGEQYFDRFYYAGVYDDQNGNYKSPNVSVSIITGRAYENDYFLADIYIQDIACLTNVFSQDEYMGSTETAKKLLSRCENGIVGINGDFYSLNLFGPLVRNGVKYVKNITRAWDIAVLRTNGELLTFRYRILTADLLSTLGAYQTWVFGPALLDDNGDAKTEFRSRVTARNPRSVLGYYEPGHYAFLIVDGRREHSMGITMQDLSSFCKELGFTRAYNLDGGQSTVLQSKSGAINIPFDGGRTLSDMFVVCDLPQE
ncbi:MAG: phosphodiester glycosidase family protein [Clostridiaceae bacterium]